MSRRSLYTSQKTTESNSIYQSFADLMSNAFMILSLLLLLVLFQSQKLNQDLQKANQRLESASPVIIDENSGKFKFQSGSAQLNPELKKHISDKVIPEINEILQSKEIDFIQVIGHTDGQKNSPNNNSNLDQTLEAVAHGKQPVSNLKPASNADLGLMRALAVIQEIENKGLNRQVQFRAYSAAQLYEPSGNLIQIPADRKPDGKRRRIEIRFIPPGQSR